MLTLTDLRKMNAADLTIELEKARASLGKTRFAVISGQEKATHKVSELRKLIAYIRTVQTEKQATQS